jgi:hypothetical protein
MGVCVDIASSNFKPATVQNENVPQNYQKNEPIVQNTTYGKFK